MLLKTMNLPHGCTWKSAVELNSESWLVWLLLPNGIIILHVQDLVLYPTRALNHSILKLNTTDAYWTCELVCKWLHQYGFSTSKHGFTSSYNMLTISYCYRSELTYVRLWIWHNHSQGCDESHKEWVGEEVDEVDGLTKRLPLVVQETANQRMCEQTKTLVACLIM